VGFDGGGVVQQDAELGVLRRKAMEGDVRALRIGTTPSTHYSVTMLPAGTGIRGAATTREPIDHGAYRL